MSNERFRAATERAQTLLRKANRLTEMVTASPEEETDRAAELAAVADELGALFEEYRDVFPDLPISATADHTDGKGTNSAVARSRSIVLTSRLPWLAPVGHRQPHRADVPQSEAVSAWERQQQELDQELNRKLIICRGC